MKKIDVMDYLKYLLQIDSDSDAYEKLNRIMALNFFKNYFRRWKECSRNLKFFEKKNSDWLEREINLEELLSDIRAGETAPDFL